MPRTSSSPVICVRHQKTAVTRSTSTLVTSVLVSAGQTPGDWVLGESLLWLALGCCLLAASFHVLFQSAPFILGCSWFRGSSLLHTFGQLPNSTVLTFTTRIAPQRKPEEISRQWVFLGETIAPRCASPGRRRRPICATGLSFWQLAYSCECFSSSLALAFGSSGVFLFAAYVLFLLFFVLFLAGRVIADRVWPLPCGLGWRGAARTLLPCHREAFGLVWWFTA